MNGDKAKALAASFWYSRAPYGWALRCDHDDVNRLLWLDEAKMHVETMSESDCRAITEIVVNVFLVDISLQFVRRCHHPEISTWRRQQHSSPRKPSACAFFAVAEPSRRATRTLAAPGSLRFSAWARPWLP